MATSNDESMAASPPSRLPLEPETTPAAVIACCNMVYGHPLAEALVGESFHPGGLPRTRELLVASALPSGSRILDVGCGLGASARVAAAEFGLSVDAIDASPAVLDAARDRAPGLHIDWQRGDVSRLEASAGTYDAVLSECVLSGAVRGEALAEIVRVLKPGGLVLMSDVETSGAAIAGFEPGSALGTALCVTSAWRPGELDERLRSSGLATLRHWDRREDILRLIERIEGRLTIARTLWSRKAGGIEAADASPLPSQEAVQEAVSSIRAAVGDGSLGYFARLAQRSS
jgi:hypothetical protein